jgi:S1-C subfamily serine protease
MSDPRALLARFERASGGKPLSEVLGKYRAIVGPAHAREPLVNAAIAALRNGEVPAPIELAALEEAIRALRPALLFSGGALPALDEAARAAFPAWESLRAAMAKHAYAVGLVVDVPRDALSAPAGLGTGFLVAEDVLMTNRHVLWAISSGTGALQEGQAAVRFGQEAQTIEAEDPVSITGVVGWHPSADVALLRVAKPPARAGREPLEIEDEPAGEGSAVAAIGYPFPDGERNPAFVRAAFGDRFGVKRASPGEVIGVEGDSLYHDASTLGGNSGSPLVAMESARAVALHSRGGFATRNEAVGGALLARFVREMLGS